MGIHAYTYTAKHLSVVIPSPPPYSIAPNSSAIRFARHPEIHRRRRRLWGIRFGSLAPHAIWGNWKIARTACGVPRAVASTILWMKFRRCCFFFWFVMMCTSRPAGCYSMREALYLPNSISDEEHLQLKRHQCALCRASVFVYVLYREHRAVLFDGATCGVRLLYFTPEVKSYIYSCGTMCGGGFIRRVLSSNK